jgi:Flp pilus assembly protein TadG
VDLENANLMKKNTRRGLATVEAAILFPLLILFLLAMVEYGWCFLKYQCINSAAREGVRVAVRDGATDTQWQAAVTSIMTGCGKRGTTPTYTVTLSPGVGSATGTQLTCTITVLYPQLNITNAPSIFPTPASLTARATMAKEGP